MLYEMFNDYVEKAFNDEYTKDVAIAMFNYMHNELSIKENNNIKHVYNLLSTVHDIVTVNTNTIEDAITIIALFNAIVDFYDSSKYRVLINSDTMILTDKTEYDKFVANEIQDITDVKAYLIF